MRLHAISADEALEIMYIVDDVLIAQGRRSETLPYWEAVVTVVRNAGSDWLGDVTVAYANSLNECGGPDEALAIVEEAEPLVGTDAAAGLLVVRHG